MIIDWHIILYTYLNLSNNIYFHIVVLLIIFDILTGYTKAYINKILNSQKGLQGMVKHTLNFFLITNIYVYATLLGFSWVATASIYVLGIGYLISILENLDAIGIWIPAFIKDRLLQIREEIDKGKIPK